MRAALHANAHTDRVEMPDLPGGNRKPVARVKDVAAVGPAVVDAKVKVKRVVAKGGAGTASDGKTIVRVTIDAPDVLHLFSNRKKKAISS
ncbi:hypothetical protein C7C56_024590 [Massilia glaciei]|uniref:Uncharacterized protein n=1 Tax=Massilia glaciei TaxID=1524097 RepID=A0A2U2HDT4_9BURK|nr:hypothetical protein C7C56_024590 [Massilia glaciei]